MARQEVELKFVVGDRTIKVKAMDQVGCEDAYNTLLMGVVHRYVTSEDVTPGIPRKIKDAIIKQNLVV